MAVFFTNSVNLTLSLTCDWAFHSLNLVPFGVPVGATGVMLLVYNYNSFARPFALRKTGSVDIFDGYTTSPEKAVTGIIGCDAAASIDYAFGPWGMAPPSMEVFLLGYFTTDAVFLTNRVDIPVTWPVTTWTHVDISGTVPPGAVAVVLELGPTGAGNIGVRRPGSSQDLQYFINHQFHIVGLPSLPSLPGIEVYESNPGDNFLHIVGYLTAGMFNYVDMPDITPTLDVWVTTDTTPYGVAGKGFEQYLKSGGAPVAYLIGFTSDGAGGYSGAVVRAADWRYAARVIGSTDDFSGYDSGIICYPAGLAPLVPPGPGPDDLMKCRKWFSGGTFQGCWVY